MSVTLDLPMMVVTADAGSSPVDPPAAPALLDVAVAAIEAWDTVCLTVKGRPTLTQELALARCAAVMQDAVMALFGDRWLSGWRAMQGYRRATYAHVRPALVHVLAERTRQ